VRALDGQQLRIRRGTSGAPAGDPRTVSIEQQAPNNKHRTTSKKQQSAHGGAYLVDKEEDDFLPMATTGSFSAPANSNPTKCSN